MHQRDVTRTLIKDKIDNPKSFDWLSQMRFYFDPKQTDVLQQLSIQMANAKFNYGFEYLGVQDKLVQTPLTDRCYLTMTQALEARLGGSPFGKEDFFFVHMAFLIFKKSTCLHIKQSRSQSLSSI